MARYAVKRIVAILPLLVLVSLGAFALTYLTPGDAAVVVAGESATPERIDEVRQTLGLNKPVIEQFSSWVGDAIRGDFGESVVSRVDVTTLVNARVGATISLILAGLIVAAVVGIPAGVLAGMRPRSVLDRVVTGLTTLGLALPAFWLAAILLIVFAVNRSVFPATGYTSFFESPFDWLHGMTLPALSIGAGSAAEVARQTRAAVADITDLDHVRTSRSLGLSPRRIIGCHVMKNAAVPVVTVLGLQVSRIIAGAVVVEQIFAIPGLGQLIVESVRARDIPTVQGIVLVIAVFTLLANLIVDLSYAVFNPRLRHQ